MSTETYLRGTPAQATEQRVLTANGETQVLPVAELMKQLGVDELIRIPAANYPEEELRGQTVLHINLPITYSRLQRKAALPRIVASGCFDPLRPDQEVTPLVSYQNIWTAGVVDFVPHASYDTLPDHMFDIPIIGGARNVLELQELVAKRYGSSYRLDEDEEINKQKILEQGLSLTWLTLGEMVSWG